MTTGMRDGLKVLEGLWNWLELVSKRCCFIVWEYVRGMCCRLLKSRTLIRSNSRPVGSYKCDLTHVRYFKIANGFLHTLITAEQSEL